MDLLFLAAGICIVVSLVLAWLASLGLYLRVPIVLKVFPAAHQLVRAHIDYLLMALLLGGLALTADAQGVDLPTATEWLMVIGAFYNPIGFIVLATRPGEKGPRDGLETWATIVGFVPATLGFGHAAILIAAESL
ncbi:MAG: hypothetical protein AAGE98_11940 [Actinomycetota bacterium]